MVGCGMKYFSERLKLERVNKSALRKNHNAVNISPTEIILLFK